MPFFVEVVIFVVVCFVVVAVVLAVAAVVHCGDVVVLAVATGIVAVAVVVS